MNQSNPQYTALLQMGFSPILSQCAIRKLKTQDITALLNWIEQNQEDQQKWSVWLQSNPQQSYIQQTTSQAVVTGQSIQQLINKQMRDKLLLKGHSKNVAEKSLLLTGNSSIEGAENWIQQHKYDPDFQEQLRLQGQASSESQLTPEQAKAKLQELTKKARQIRKKREQQEAVEREKNRVKYTKQMQEAKRIAEQQAMKRKVELDKIQKKRDQEYKKKLLEDMRRQKNVKQGIKEPPIQDLPQSKKQEKKISLLDQIQLQCEQVKVGNHAYPDVAKTFFQTAQIYVNNIIKSNGDEKFRKINKENKAFQNRICQAFGGIELLNVLGYEEEGNTLIMKTYDLKQLSKASEILERYKSWY